jgi:hypothetical protein
VPKCFGGGHYRHLNDEYVYLYLLYPIFCG